MHRFDLLILILGLCILMLPLSLDAQENEGDAQGEDRTTSEETGDAEIEPGEAGDADNELDKDGGADPEEGKYTRRGYVRMLVPNGRITGNTTDKLYHIEGGLEIYYFNMVVKGDSADVDQNAETATLKGNVFIEDPDYRINCEQMEIAYNENWLKATGFVQFERYNLGIAQVIDGAAKRAKVLTVFKNKRTKVYCSKLEYNWETEDFSATGEVKVVQDDAVIEASEMRYDSASNAYILSGDVVMTFEKYSWLFESGIVESEDEDILGALTKKPSTIKCDRMAINEGTGLMRCTMNKDSEDRVVFNQVDKKIECVELEVNDSTKLLVAKGDVKYWQKDGNWLLEGGLIKEEEAEGEILEELDNPMTLTTEILSFDYHLRKMQSEGETIRIEGRDGKYAECSLMNYDDKAKTLEMAGGVVISSGKEYLYCDSLRADTDNKVYEFFGDVDGFFKYESRGEPDETADVESGSVSGEGQSGSSPPAPPVE
ncbi:hypothetical protein J7K50_03700 [bacterium]|nr:hypothetical protein [bacterium]